MIEVWYLVITLFVLQSDGTIDKRHLYSVKQADEVSCRLEANARIELFTDYLGKDHIRRFSTTSCGTYGYFGGRCKLPEYDKNDPYSGTYRIGLNGTLVQFQVGCENRPEPIGPLTPIPPTGRYYEQTGPRSFP